MAYGDDFEGTYLICNLTHNQQVLLDSPKDLRAYIFDHIDDWMRLYMHERDCIVDAQSLLDHLVALTVEELE